MLRSIILLLFIGTLSQTIAQSSEWKLEKQGNGIKVFTRKLEGRSVKEFKAITTVTCSMQTLDDLLADIPGYPDWQANVASGKVLKKINENEKYLYYTTDLPWPFDDRDVVVIAKRIKMKNGSLKVTMDSRPDYIPEKEGFIRMQEITGFWLFVPKPDNKIKVIYQYYGDPAGELPASIINMFIVSGPYDTLTNLRKMK